MQLSAAITATRRYIADHWTETVRTSREDTPNEISLPHPHTVPSTDPSMWLFFYWDVYFTNLGLLRSGHIEQARHNADNILSLIGRFGYVPNMTVRIALNRTQIPLSAIICRDVHAATGDDAWLARALPLLEHEYTFWMALRLAPNAWPPLQCAAIMGLQHYGYHTEARRLAEKYVHTCARNFAQTGQLWEKYNGVTGGIDVADEYRMPPMLGWTAGIFLYAEEVLAGNNQTG